MMGHARSSVNGKHYSKREQTEGLAVISRERLAFISRYITNITSSVLPTTVALLPVDERSRLGSGMLRRKRSDAGRMAQELTS